MIDYFISKSKEWYPDHKDWYHSWDHAYEVYCFVKRHGGDIPVQLGALYHDVIYIPGYQDNEKLSGEVLISDGRRYATRDDTFNLDYIYAGAHLIEQTQLSYHLSKSRLYGDVALLLDGDLSPLAYYWSDFVENQVKILNENNLKPTDLHKSAEFLKQFLTCREYIYHTDFAREECEDIARKNIIRLIYEFGV